ncbi:MAG: CHASE domain-containing protein [Candidatus Omnitrophica bacterium]|nr:CHASE domain-containing protein [Candidatus Omnitrophota bacterium]
MESVSKSHSKTTPEEKHILFIHGPATAWIVLFFSIIFTIIAFFLSNRFVHQRASDHFQYRVEEIASAIEDRLELYEQVLRGGVGLFNASGEVSREEWRKYVDTLDINKHWPGIQGVGFSVVVKPEDMERHIAQIRSEGFPEYAISPSGERELYTTIIYLEPFDWRNQRAFGYDMWSNDIRRQAMIRARDTGEPSRSGRITLVQETNEDVQPGFLIYLPVYAKGASLVSVTDRRKAFLGWVYSPFRANDFMKGILGSEDPGIHFSVYDGENVAEGQRVYSTKGAPYNAKSSHFEKEIVIHLQGRPWAIHFYSSENFLKEKATILTKLVAVGGIIVDILLFYVIYAIYFVQRRAVGIAKNMTKQFEDQAKELEHAKDGLETKVRERTSELERARDHLEKEIMRRTGELEQGMEELKKANKIMIGREKRMVELKQMINDLSEELGREKPFTLQ